MTHILPACVNGHPYDATNSYISPKGLRYCRICQKAAARRWNAKPAVRERHNTSVRNWYRRRREAA